MPAYPPTPIATLSVMENFTCTDHYNTVLAFKCLGYPISYTSVTTVPCTPGHEYGILKDHICAEAELQKALTIILSVVFSLVVVAFILVGAYVLRKRINREALLVWRATGEEVVDNGKNGKEFQEIVDEGLVIRVECKVPPKAFNPKQMVPPDYSLEGDGHLVRISTSHYDDDDGHMRHHGGCM